MRTATALILALTIFTSCQTTNQAQKRHKAYKATGKKPACIAGTGCRR